MLWLSELGIIDSLLTRYDDTNDWNKFRKKKTELNSRGVLVVSNGFVIRKAAGGGDCFFD